MLNEVLPQFWNVSYSIYCIVVLPAFTVNLFKGQVQFCLLERAVEAAFLVNYEVAIAL